MYDSQTRAHALNLLASGLTLSEVTRATGISRHAICDWRDGPRYKRRGPDRSTCCRCRVPPALPDDRQSYSYLLGLYLGDGCLSNGAAMRAKGVWTLGIACSDAWPGLMFACAKAISAVIPHNKVNTVARPGMHNVVCYSKHWPCLLPQHGPGMKHTRRIVLHEWQQIIVDEYPHEFVRGLIHSDGCRVINWTTRPVAGEIKRYEYPRYHFTNESADIRDLYTGTLDKLGIAWRYNRHNCISVARREAVAMMDAFVGPKY